MKMEMAQNLPNTVDDEWDRSMQHFDIINSIDCINRGVIMMMECTHQTKEGQSLFSCRGSSSQANGGLSVTLQNLVDQLKNMIGSDDSLMRYYLSNCSREANLWNSSARFFKGLSANLTDTEFALNLRLQLLNPPVSFNANQASVRCMCGPKLL
jgi:hypothetical protein